MGRALGVVVSASVLAASYQLMLDEGRIFVRTLSARRQRRHARHELVLVQVLGKGLAAAAENQLLNSRDAFAEALSLLATGRSR